ncbi:hypothetical protein BTO32_16500 [Marinobacter lutaoensis]|uniref:Uncharacterized protein n=1 Tax=Marinobacter lutaoensis TaxID=135739 RepID=A0A1V2DP02_9GAMM|nr:hypothetical protein BTO32_16500 [Marinobacter lutaoensis]
MCDELPLNEKGDAETEAELDRDIRRTKNTLSRDESLNKVDRFLKKNRPRMGRGVRQGRRPVSSRS